MMNTEHMIEQALILAARLHTGQTRRDGSPYIFHPITVAMLVRDLGGDEVCQTAALLHDVLEDTDASEEDLAPFGEAVVRAVRLVTRPEGADEAEYVAAILEDPVAAAVKNADKMHNVRDCVVLAASEETRSERSRAFALRYIAKARKYYYGRFSAELDRVIREAEEAMAGEKDG